MKKISKILNKRNKNRFHWHSNEEIWEFMTPLMEVMTSLDWYITYYDPLSRDLHFYVNCTVRDIKDVYPNLDFSHFFSTFVEGYVIVYTKI